jgi:predicted cobalt transporter CbtA
MGETTETWSARLRRGLLAGLAGGVAAAAVLWLLVEPALERAIALEASGADGHTHGGGVAHHSHDSGEAVTRLQQQVGGTVTVIVVSVLLGLAFAVVHARSRHRLGRGSDVARSVALGGLAFGVLALAPAVLVPANPPGVGDPATVNSRTLTYVLALLLGTLVVGAVFAVHARLRDRGASRATLIAGTASVACALIAALFVLGPRVSETVPAGMPTDLLWQFRSASLLQLAAMWLVMGLVHGLLEQRAHRPARPAARVPSPQPTGA